MPVPHLAWQLGSGSPPPGGYRIGLDWKPASCWP